VRVVSRFTVYGPPRTKKNSNEIRRRGGARSGRCHCCGKLKGAPFVAPSRAWEAWLASAVIVFQPLSCRHVTEPVNCNAVFYRDKKSKNQGDACGFYQGLADVLEKHGVVANDSLIVTWWGTRLDVDVDNPRTEVVLEGAQRIL